VKHSGDKRQIVLLTRPDAVSFVRGSARDASKHFGGLRFEARTAPSADLGEERLEFAPQVLCDTGLSLLFVDHAAAGGLETGRECRRGVCKVGIDHAFEIAWLESKHPGLDQEEQLELRLGHMAQRREQDRQIAFVLLLGCGRRIPLSGFEIDTICRASNFRHPLRRAANRANVVAQSGTGATSLSNATEGANHRAIVRSGGAGRFRGTAR